MPIQVGIIGCGVVGAAIAYTLSQMPGVKVWVWDRRLPQAYEATGAALGVLMAVSSPKLKGRHLQLRLESLRQYEALIPRLQAQTHIEIPYNRQGILKLCFSVDELQRWQAIQGVRQRQGFGLEIWNAVQLSEFYPELMQARCLEPPMGVQGAIYSPDDRQVDPVVLTQALLVGAQRQGAQVRFETEIQAWREERGEMGEGSDRTLTHICTPQGDYALDWLIVAAGLGSVPLAAQWQHPVPMEPVLGQALQLRLPRPWRYPQPVISGNDIHLVPLNAQELWVGATVEFAANAEVPRADRQALERLYQGAIALYPDLAEAQILKTWSGHRPRPVGQAAPVIKRLSPYANVILASGHYRNGVLLAPITATKIQQFLCP
ncbi:FAD-dependent oxidoreductase [Synechococcales cyanobacterium C]|uniref:FAD-dependent oxidoreductase n=1 Tax=Petrachloros mirabilis ULC683 TaxID=2781853 RepID=A0A8K2A803_9CYAN|nr:FAD-dependent oxidoreductase [Petrachloros mirabilis]NCJ07474.1 FAD-dependent oxidoreductase [Petrachloros mirabilis ULC683]